MRRRRSLLKRSLTPLGNWGQWFLYSLLLGLAILLILITRLNENALSNARALLLDLTVPVLDGLMRPISASQDIIDNIQSYGQLQSEVVRLREALNELQELQTRTDGLQSENEQLKKLVNFTEDEKYEALTVRIVSDRGGLYSKSLLINAGTDQDVRVGMGATIANRLAGRVVTVGKSAARVLLLTDINSRIPVIVESTGAQAVLAGNNSSSLELLHLSPAAQAEIKEDDRLITSGSGGVFPFGILAGRVVRVTPSGVIVKPMVDWESALFLKVLDFDICHFTIDADVCQGS